MPIRFEPQQTLVIEVKLGNEGMNCAEHVSAAITYALYAQGSSMTRPFNEHEMGTIRDRDGNDVGTWEVC